MGHQELQGLHAGFVAHQGPVAFEGPLGGKAVFAADVAVVGHVQAQGLDDGIMPAHLVGIQLGVLRKELTGRDQTVDFRQGLRHRLLGVALPAFPEQGFPIRVGVSVQQRINQGVHRMDGAAVDVHDDKEVVLLELMNHNSLLSESN